MKGSFLPLLPFLLSSLTSPARVGAREREKISACLPGSRDKHHVSSSYTECG